MPGICVVGNARGASGATFFPGVGQKTFSSTGNLPAPKPTAADFAISYNASTPPPAASATHFPSELETSALTRFFALHAVSSPDTPAMPFPKQAPDAFTPFGERFRIALAASSFASRRHFADTVRESETFVRRAEVGKTDPRLEQIKSWAAALEIDPHWLAFGGPYLHAGTRGGFIKRMLERLDDEGQQIASRLLPPYLIDEPRAYRAASAADFDLALKVFLPQLDFRTPHLRAELAARPLSRDSALALESDETRTTPFYPAFAVFLEQLRREHPEAVPSPERLAWMQQLVFPPDLRPTPLAYHNLLLVLQATEKKAR